MGKREKERNKAERAAKEKERKEAEEKMETEEKPPKRKKKKHRKQSQQSSGDEKAAASGGSKQKKVEGGVSGGNQKKKKGHISSSPSSSDSEQAHGQRRVQSRASKERSGDRDSESLHKGVGLLSDDETSPPKPQTPRKVRKRTESPEEQRTDSPMQQDEPSDQSGESDQSDSDADSRKSIVGSDSSDDEKKKGPPGDILDDVELEDETMEEEEIVTREDNPIEEAAAQMNYEMLDQLLTNTERAEEEQSKKIFKLHKKVEEETVKHKPPSTPMKQGTSLTKTVSGLKSQVSSLVKGHRTGSVSGTDSRKQGGGSKDRDKRDSSRNGGRSISKERSNPGKRGKPREAERVSSPRPGKRGKPRGTDRVPSPKPGEREDIEKGHPRESVYGHNRTKQTGNDL